MPKGSASGALARFGRDSSGATAVEFALIGAPFFFLLGSVLEIGVMLFTEYRLQNGVEAAARLMRTGQPGVANSEQFTIVLCGQTFNIPGCADRVGFVVATGPTFQTINLPPLASIGPGQRTFNQGNPRQAMAIVATIDWAFILPQMQLLGNVSGGAQRRLQGIAVFQNEPFSRP